MTKMKCLGDEYPSVREALEVLAHDNGMRLDEDYDFWNVEELKACEKVFKVLDTELQNIVTQEQYLERVKYDVVAGDEWKTEFAQCNALVEFSIGSDFITQTILEIYPDYDIAYDFLHKVFDGSYFDAMCSIV